MLGGAGEWHQYADDNGRVYLYNARSGETRWLWEKYTDPNTRRDYYNNVITGESRWTEELDHTAHGRKRPEPSRAPVDHLRSRGDSGHRSREAAHAPRTTQVQTPGAASAGALANQDQSQAREKIKFKVGGGAANGAPRKAGPDAVTHGARTFDPDEEEDVDPSGRPFIYNRRTKQSRYLDGAAPEIGVGIPTPQPDHRAERAPQADNPLGNVAAAAGAAARDIDAGHDAPNMNVQLDVQPTPAVRSSPPSRSRGGPRKNTDESGIFKEGQRFHCEPCERKFGDHQSMKAHSRGRRHIENLASWRKANERDPSSSPPAKRPRGASAAELTVDGFLRGSYPSALKNWISQSRRNARSEADKHRIDAKLDEAMSKSIKSGDLWSRDWTQAEPLAVTAEEGPGPGQNDKLGSAKGLSWGKKKAESYEKEFSAQQQQQTKRKGQNGVKDEGSGAKVVASRAYHDVSKDELEVVLDGEPRSKGGKAMLAAVDNAELSAAFRRCKPVWSQTVVFGAEHSKRRIVGRNESLEKAFLRMNNFEADPDEVRPPEVLKKSLDYVLGRYRSGEKDYTYLVKQFKSMRQDLLVQAVRDEISVRMYEEHARIAIQCRDVGELNQCLTQLKELYQEVVDRHRISSSERAQLPGAGAAFADSYAPREKIPSDNRDEFLAYSVLYEVYSTFVSDKNRRNLLKIMSEVPRDPATAPMVAFALRCRSVLSLGEFWKTPQLFAEARKLPAGENLCAVLDLYRNPVLSRALRVMARAYRPSIPVSVIANRQGLLPVETVALPAIREAKAVLATGEDGVDVMLCKESMATVVMMRPVGITAMGGS